MFTRFLSRPGWLIYFFLITFTSMKNINLFSRKRLKSFISSLRNRSTSAEAALWNILKSKKLAGKKFRRLYSIGSYIVDFCCPSEKLIIELGGEPHGEYYKIQKDENRDKYLESLGFNQPPRPQTGFEIFSFYCAAATPPSKGGESTN
jgi:very-short-patch-repair endonuclease